MKGKRVPQQMPINRKELYEANASHGVRETIGKKQNVKERECVRERK